MNIKNEFQFNETYEFLIQVLFNFISTDLIENEDLSKDKELVTFIHSCSTVLGKIYNDINSLEENTPEVLRLISIKEKYIDTLKKHLEITKDQDWKNPFAGMYTEQLIENLEEILTILETEIKSHVN